MTDSNKASSTPMILGIVGFVTSLPGLFCTAMCAGFVDAAERATHSGSSAGKTWMWINIAAALLGLIGGIMSKSQPKQGGTMMIVATIVTLIITFLTMNIIWGIITAVCFLIGGIKSFGQPV